MLCCATHYSKSAQCKRKSDVCSVMPTDSVELCETEVCFLHIQLIGTNVWLPKIHNVAPDVDLESSRSLAKSES